VLEQIGFPNTSGFRIGLGDSSTDEDVDRLLAELPGIVRELREVEHASAEALSRFRPPAP
jgi:cysteine sulfinate desulfinase/cysteine desulfurase-like protein